ncbi:MAG: pirin family protein [Rudaea sp.]
MKKLAAVHQAPSRHWVGDGFPVRSLFSYNDHGRELSPFLLLDHAGPMRFDPAAKPRGVGEHPHRGFETVTIVYAGEVAHRDSTGAGGTIGPGDVQWMTAASGIVHEEFHSEAFTRNGGDLEMVQLWVNLPAADKMSKPRYQNILNRDIPVVELPDGAGSVRVIAGEYTGHRGPALTFTPLDVWDVRLHSGHDVQFDLLAGRTLALVVLQGEVRINNEAIAHAGQLATFARDGETIALHAESDAKILLLSGEPIDEPVAGYGPFVMNNEQQLREAFVDYQSGRMGHLARGTVAA